MGKINKILELQAENERLRISGVPVSSIKKMVDYLYADEKKDAEILQEEQGDCKGHIFEHIEKVDNWLNYIDTGSHKVL